MAFSVVFANAEEKSEAVKKENSKFDFDLGLSVSEEFSDNIYSTENDKADDLITKIVPEARVTYKGEEVKISLEGRAEKAFYRSHTDEDYLDGSVGAAAEWKIGEAITLFLGGSHDWEHEERSSPDGVDGLEPTEYREADAYAALQYKTGKLSTRLGINLNNYDFDDTPVSSVSTINNDDRDRLQSEYGIRLGYEYEKARTVFIQGIYNQRDYVSDVDDAGFDRESHGVEINLGLSGRIGPVWGEVSAGFLQQYYDDNAFDTVTVPDFGANITWAASPGTRVTALLDRTIEETTLSGASSYLNTTAGVRVSHRFASDLVGRTYLYLSENDYQDSDLANYVTEAGLGLRYYVTPRLYVDGGYSFEQRSSNVAGGDYDSHGIQLRVGAEFDEFYKDGSGVAEMSNSGFYIGALVSHQGLNTALDGPRGAGTVTNSFGDWGLGGGALIGYRAQLGKLALGLELDGELESARWSHNADRTFAVEKENTIGLSAILSFETRNNVLLYGRGGVVSSEFKSEYDNGLDTASKTDRETGLRIGGGAEFPLGGSFSGRMEYAITGYPDYEMGAPLGGGDDDNFSNTDALARFALIYHFNNQESEEEVKPTDFTGFYIGGFAAHGLLGTENSGPRPNAAAPTFTLNALRADQGIGGGLLVGYGHRIGDFYLGAEVDGELSGASWNIERDPNGRIYSVEKIASLGAALRAGYIVGDSVLLYGRAGAVQSWFETEYTVGGGTVYPDDSVLGIRYGGGVEFALTDALRMRLDYTLTDYENYLVTYASGSDDFGHLESQFRLGVTYQY